MIANRNFETCQPLTWVGQVPVYLATALAAAHAVTMILSGLAMAAGAEWFFQIFAFSPEQAIGQWHVWQFVTYAFVYNDPQSFLWTVIQLVLLARFGRDVETFIGRAGFAWMYGVLVLVPPAFLTLLSIFGPSISFVGSDGTHFAVFLAFVMIYPRAEIFFTIQARWIAIILVGVYSLQALATGAMVRLAMMWLQYGTVALWMVKEGVFAVSLPSLPQTLRRRHSERSLRVVREEPEEELGLHESIDPILEKIARNGIASLTRNEREKLERARAALLEKERRP